MHGLGMSMALDGAQSASAAAWAPTQLAGLVSLYNMDISSTADQKGSNNLTASGTSAGPAVNGHASVATTGGGNLIKTGFALGASPAGLTTWCVAKIVNIPASYGEIMSYGVTDWQEILCTNDSTGHLGEFNNTAVAASTIDGHAAWHLIVMTENSASGNQELWIDGVSVATQAAGTIATGKDLAFGMRSDTTLAADVAIAMAGVCNVKLGSSDQASLHAYCQTRFGTP